MLVDRQTAATAESRTTYGSFLRLDELLALQASGARNGEASLVALEKHFFVVIHQAFELWFKQIIYDIDYAIGDLDRDGSRSQDAVTKLERVVAVLRLLVGQMELLSQLDCAAFLEFRGELGTSSAAQSRQFHEIQGRLGLLSDDDHGPLRRAVSRGGRENGAGSRSRAMDAVDEISDMWLRLWAGHASTVERYIGESAGTGGTSGVAYLRSHLAKLNERAANARGEAGWRQR